MEYKEYEIRAEVQTLEVWTIDESGQPVDLITNANGSDVSGYFYRNETTGDDFYLSSTLMNMEQHQNAIAMHLEELAGAKS
jgi:hypothetical protein